MSKIKNSDITRFIQAVSDVKIQGATAVAEATIDALVQYLAVAQIPVRATDWQKFARLADELAQIRPTEPLARNLSRWLIYELKKNFKTQRKPLDNWFSQVNKLGQELKYLLKEADANLSEVGSKLVANNQIIFTHCHSSLAESILIRGRQQHKKFKIYHTETRPLFQGRITSRHLKRAGIPATMVADSAAAWLVSNHSGDEVKVSWVLLGADSIARDGSVINKIGSFAIALAAYDSSIPLYIASSLLKIDALGESKIELRSAAEIWPSAPPGINIVNYAFDRIPAKYIRGIICEFGIIKPNKVLALARQKYKSVFMSANKY
ncbi:MAG: hypothetical protein A2588_03425 [Candidatus Veblenbacteria bacterium RIFOXYD1_FULL_43_11]|uniref:Ribose 1,5-bisphosphate isomerase n=1 Tax=Candidatus Veblenbacteria bacterium RIFOXYD1_FULL_43_11 TaxID=1802429 RepID=A0A1G2QBT8_9BACT|nr:MAG: hypothetical protein A2588_03425 [Candidatus Veblenbacteria bacterium RIFOXYD1_FULL_43_11]